ncbi:ABC transporter permease [Rhodococcus sp. ACPA4]|uniref:Peptide/nickel transport system permease protein n=2 Tax=Nocardiaceae TaxID=85025 RepID=A0A652YHT6_NOCGL|nr:MULTISPECIES: ABC transporter permease [Rhodococcus]NMD64330.1 ABC transporter permease [Nocardia globerula]MCE4265818.1 ABC transporter permease [Rhodococcus globerulus]MDV6270484.1 ABC transporter permease [Rhodococcus globerulus]MDV8071100.1 ABC transporter permease [Rhodococcus sp. IEGM 1366]NRI70032.1 ABC transporter permease [Rhodococcus sp. MS16]
MSEVIQDSPGSVAVAERNAQSPLPEVVIKPIRRRRDIGALIGVIWITVVCLGAIFANVLPLPDPNDVSSVFNAIPGTDGHILGTDSLGRDVLSRLIFGARVSLAVAIGATSISLVLGVTLGMLAGYFGGTVDKFISLFINFTLSFPPLIFLIAMVAVLEPSLSTLVIALAIMGIPNFARVARANTLAFAEREFVTAAKSLGASPLRILLRELLANVMLPILSLALVVMATLVIAEGSLSFLGVGVPPPTPSWGGMLAAGREQMSRHPQLVLIPALFFFVTVFSFNRIGDWVRGRVGKDSAI